MMKNWFKNKGNWIFVLLLAFLILKQTPVVWNNFKQEKKILAAHEVRVSGTERTMLFPPDNKKLIAIFWASWCGPCKIEMERLKKSVLAGDIPGKRIFAVNPFESSQEIKAFLQKHSFPFVFIESASLASDLGVNVTPTTMLVDNYRIESMSSGLSVWGIWKFQHTFRDAQ